MRILQAKMFSSIHRSLRKSTLQQVRGLAASFDGYGQHLFKGAVAAPYLEKAGLPKDTLDGTAWTTNGNADKVAAAVLEWAKDNGASVYCHWFQPQGAAGFRHGMTGQVQNTMLEFGRDGKPLWDFKGKNILKGIILSLQSGITSLVTLDHKHLHLYPQLVCLSLFTDTRLFYFLITSS